MGPSLIPVAAAALVESLWRDLRLATRRLRATPVFSTFAVISLALGLGVTTAIYATMASLFWNPSSITDPEHLALVTERRVDASDPTWRGTVSAADFDILRRQLQSAPDVAASSGVLAPLDDGITTTSFEADAVTGNYFEVIKLPVALGRGIEERDNRSQDSVIVLSHHAWETRFGSDKNVLGRTVRFRGHPFVVVGVTSARFARFKIVPGFVTTEFGVSAEGWIPLTARRTVADGPANPADLPLSVVGRLPTGVAVATVAAEVANLGIQLDRSAPIYAADTTGGHVMNPRSWSVTTVAATSRDQARANGRVVWTVVLLVALVLVVACTNIANLMLGRGAARSHDLAVQRALGASRARLIREHCAEGAILTIVGGAGALLIAGLLCRYFTTDLPSGVAAKTMSLLPQLTAPVLLAAAACLVVAFVVFGFLPALQLTRASLRQRMAGDSAGSPATRWKGRRQLIGWQVGIAATLILIAAAAARQAASDALHDPGFDLQHLAVATIELPTTPGDDNRTRRLLDELEVAANDEPGFESVALTDGLPTGIRRFATVTAAGQRVDPSSSRNGAVSVAATQGIFRTLAVPIVKGRAFDTRDTAATQHVIVLSEHVARQLFDITDVVGRRVVYSGPSGDASEAEVIGIARDTDAARLSDRTYGLVYVPFAQHTPSSVAIVGRTVRDPRAMIGAFARIVRRADPDLAVSDATTGAMVMAPTSVVIGIIARLAGSLSLLALLLAMIGLYGVLSHLVTGRTREIGLRLALGADASRIRRMILGDGMRPVLWGLVIGFVAGTGGRLVLRATGPAGIAAVEPISLLMAAVTLLSAGLLACDLPARRASSVDPNVALRSV